MGNPETGDQEDWSTGTYSYDGAGNIIGMGEDWYTYDAVSRLTANSYPGTSGNCPLVLLDMHYSHDLYGNLLSWAYNCSGEHTFSVDATTNRLLDLGYDEAGAVVSDPGFGNPRTLGYYALGNLRSAVATGLNDTYFYTADGERIAVKDELTGDYRVTLRDLSGLVLREESYDGSAWTWVKDYVYRGGALVGSVTKDEDDNPVFRHFHLDHLGTPRLITDGAGYRVEYHVYVPYGIEATAAGDERMKFTGHERDLESDLDSMHARYYNQYNARFLSVDPLRGDPHSPQSFNLFGYVRWNPPSYIDPRGLKPRKPHGPPPTGENGRPCRWTERGWDCGFKNETEAIVPDRAKRREFGFKEWYLESRMEYFALREATWREMRDHRSPALELVEEIGDLAPDYAPCPASFRAMVMDRYRTTAPYLLQPFEPGLVGVRLAALTGSPTPANAVGLPNFFDFVNPGLLASRGPWAFAGGGLVNGLAFGAALRTGMVAGAAIDLALFTPCDF